MILKVKKHSHGTHYILIGISGKVLLRLCISNNGQRLWMSEEF